MITAQIIYVADLKDLPGVVPGFADALGLTDEDAFDILADAAQVKNDVVLQMTDAAFGRLIASCNITLDPNLEERGFDLTVEVLHSEDDPQLIAAYVVDTTDIPEDAGGPTTAPREGGTHDHYFAVGRPGLA